MPAVDSDGKILLAEKGHIALSPDGHGGALRALVRSGSIRNMEADGVDIVSYFQVDNPLVPLHRSCFHRISPDEQLRTVELDGSQGLRRGKSGCVL